MSLPIDRTTKSALDNNLVNGNTSDAPVIKNSNDVVYNTIDELNAKVDGLVNSSALSPYPPTFLQRQAAINGNFDIAQRGTSFTNPANNQYTLDRWKIGNLNMTSPATITHSQIGLIPGDVANSFNYYRISPSANATAFNVNGFAEYNISQFIENGTRFLCGAGKKVTVSFYARGAVANKKIGIYAIQSYGTGGSPSPLEVISGTNWTLTTGWTKYTFTFTTNTLVGKTFGTNNDDTLNIYFPVLWDITGIGPRVVSSFQENFGGGGVIDIAQVQVNAGSQVLPFQPRSFAEELVLCQRYYEKTYSQGVNPATNTQVGAQGGIAPLAGYVIGSFKFQVTKRVNPTVTLYSATGTANKVTTTAGADIGITVTPTNISTSGFPLVTDSGTGFTIGSGYYFHFTSDSEI